MQSHLVVPEEKQHDDVLIINPTDMTPDQAELVRILFSQNMKNQRNNKRATRVYHQAQFEGRFYYYDVYFPDPECSENLIKKRIQFTHTIVRRSKRDAQRNKHYLYDVISNDAKNASGRFGVVSKISHKLSVFKNAVLRTKPVKHKVIKMIDTARALNLTLAIREVEIGSKLPHLDASKLTKEKDYYGANQRAYFTMDEAPGEDLSQLLQRDRDSGYTLISSCDRLRLSFNLADALNRQMHKRGYIHRDFKPENIRVDEKYQVRCVDVGLAGAQHEENLFLAGSNAYISLWLAQHKEPISSANDCYSLGLILLELWFGQSRCDYITANKDDAMPLDTKEVAVVADVAEVIKHTGLAKNSATEIIDCIKQLLIPMPMRATANITADRFKTVAINQMQIYFSAAGEELHAQFIALGKKYKEELTSILENASSYVAVWSFLKEALENLPRLTDDTFENETIIASFIDAMDIKTFKGLSSVQALVEARNKIEKDYIEYTNELIDLANRLKAIDTNLNYANSELKNKLQMTFDIVENDLKSLRTKASKPKRQFALDECVYVCEKFKEEIPQLKVQISKLEAALKPAVLLADIVCSHRVKEIHSILTSPSTTSSFNGGQACSVMIMK